MPILITQTKIQGVLFDLDGTLLDTAPDLAAALNHVLATQGVMSLSLNDIRPFISTGVAGLLKFGLDISEQDGAFPLLRSQFIDYYTQHIGVNTRLFPGVPALINFLQDNKQAWGIVTNKSSALTTLLIKQFPLLKHATCIIAGDSLKHHKPHPQPLLHACQCMACLPENCIYIGDAKRDIDAANAAGMYSCVALYGYIHNEENINAWNASAKISSPLDIIDYLK